MFVLGMMRLSSTTISILASALAVTSAAPAQSAEECKGIWSSSGQQPHVGDAYTADAIVSPDKQSSLAVSEEVVQFIRGSGAPVKLDVPINTALMEIVWSQDSSGFALNVSDGVNEGPWQTFIYRIVGERFEPMRVPLDSYIKEAMTALPRCDAKAPANVASVGWIEGGKEILVVAETPTLASCKSKTGDVTGFRLSATTGKILERVSRTAITQDWPKQLGCRLRRE
jgi:hypothetical protein